ncbi:unnamed protein product, partial [Mesorhabditis spiculigera]
MNRTALLLFALAALALSQVAAPGNDTETSSPLKDDAEGRGGRHHDRSDSREHHYRRHHHHHGHQDYGFGPQFYQSEIHDRHVCDLDASVLLVLSRSHGALHRAHRVRCSDVAAADEDSCNICCQNAARRDLTLKNENIYGVLIDTDGIDSKHRHDNSKEHGRYKRSHDDRSDELTRDGLRDTFPNADHFPWKYSKPNFFKNVKCLCCAPRRHYNGPQPVAQAPPQYQQPQYPQPVAAAPPQPTYQQPTYQQPSYGQPAAQQPQPTYQAPSYGQAAAPPQQQY